MRKLTLLSFMALAFPSAVSAATYSQNFTAANGTTGAGLGDGSSINGGNATGYFPAVRGNVLELTSAAADSTGSSFIVPAVANSALGFTMDFDLVMSDIAGGNLPADGLSIAYANTITLASNFGEEGPGGNDSYAWVVDTWDNGTSDRGVRSKIDGTNDFVQTFVPLADGATLTAHVTLAWHPVNGASLQIGPTAYFTNRPDGDFTGGNNYLFGFGARTGGATETVTIDNLVIRTIPEPAFAAFAGMTAMVGVLRRRR